MGSVHRKLVTWDNAILINGLLYDDSIFQRFRDIMISLRWLSFDVMVWYFVNIRVSKIILYTPKHGRHTVDNLYSK